MENGTPLSKVRLHLAQLKRIRSTYEPHWREVRDYITPERGRLLTGESPSEVNNGFRNESKRITGEASRALRILASGMQSGLTSKARQWFMLGHPDPDLNRFKAVREWYDHVQMVLEGIFRRSNIYSTFLHTYTEMAAFGQGAMSLYSHPERTLHCRSHTTGTYYMSCDQWGDVDTFFQVEYLTVSQLVEAYGLDKMPQSVKSKYDSSSYEDLYGVVHGIFRHGEQYGLPVKEDKPVVSVHFLLRQESEDDEFLRIGHYTTFPVMTPRWEVIDSDVYGSGPTRDVINDVKMVMAMEKDAFKASAKSVNPPWRVPPELERRGLDTRPGALNVVSSMGEHAVAPLFTNPVNLQQLQFKIDSVIQGIRDGYYNSLFLALLTQDNPQMTAREVAERHEEKLLMLGPVLERIHMELLDPVIDRAFALAWEEGLIKPPPEDLEGEPTQVEYVSILSQAQKAVGVNRIEQSAAFLGSMAQMYPEARHLFNLEWTMREYNNMIGAPGGMLRSSEEYQKSVSEEQQKAAMAQGAESLAAAGQGAKALGETDMANVRDLLSGTEGGLVL